MASVENPATKRVQKEFVITRHFRCTPRGRVAGVDRMRAAEALMGPTGFVTHTCKLALRDGGIFHYGMRGPDGEDLWGRFVYREIVAPQRLAFIASFSDAQGYMTRHPWFPTWPMQTLSSVTFEEHEGKTRVTVEWIPYDATEEERKTFEAGRDSMKQGWTGTFDRLDAYSRALPADR